MKRHDFHSHSTLSDGTLLPSELVRRAVVKGLSSIAITDHVGFENYQSICEALRKLAEMSDDYGITIIAGVEITHVPPRRIAELAALIKGYGSMLVVVHGETTIEPVMPGTNRASVEAAGLVDILAHPGLISADDAAIAAANGVFLEITTNHGHALANGHVLQQSRMVGAKLLVNSDSHSSAAILDSDAAQRALLGAGATAEECEDVLERNPLILLNRLGIHQ